jgi:hypothetical protein
MQELYRIKMPSKESCLASCPRGMATNGAHTLLLGTDVSPPFCLLDQPLLCDPLFVYMYKTL